MSDEPLLGSEEFTDEFDLDIEGLDQVRYAVKLDNMSKTYELGKTTIKALDKISLTVGPGEIIVVSGPSGSGKTTLLNIIGAIDHATEGRVYVMDVPIGDYDEAFRATFRLYNTGYIFQSYNLISTLTAIENVMFPMQLTEKSEKELRGDAKILLERVGMHERLEHLPWQLSSGEQQRVAIARAMANDPALILADEPTANLDADTGQSIILLLQELNKAGKTLVVMTHDERILSLPSVRHLRIQNGVMQEDV